MKKQIGATFLAIALAASLAPSAVAYEGRGDVTQGGFYGQEQQSTPGQFKKDNGEEENKDTKVDPPIEEEASYTVYVYVAGKNDDGETLFDECLELLGVDPNTLDAEGYFPIGEITLDNYLAAAGYTSVEDVPQNTALITSEDIMAAVEQDLKTLYTTNLENNNTNNCVADYVNQVIAFYGFTGSDGQSTMLCRRDDNYKTSHGFSNESEFDILFHLDLCFNTKTITFELGNNSLDNDGTVVDTRTYIEGCEIQNPKDFSSVIPEHYNWDGKYYADADFTTEWDGIGTALTENQTVYIKLIPEDQVFINYEIAEGEGTLSAETETLYVSALTANGSTAAAAANYTFVGWYADKDCTTLLSTDATYVPLVPEIGWVNGTTYYAKFVKNEEETPVIPTEPDKKDDDTPSRPSNDDDDDTTPSDDDDTPSIPSNDDDDEIIIDDDDTPLAPTPNEDVTPSEDPTPIEDEEIPDEEVPMADVPKTGDNTTLIYWLFAASCIGLIYMFKRGFKGE